MKLNLGCGSQTPDGWINVDYALGARLVKIPLFRRFNKKVRLFNLDWDDRIYIHNLTNRFPWRASSVDVVYTSHTLEHFTRQEGLAFLKECHRILKPGGIVRIVVPDLARFVSEYVQKKIRADEFVEKLGVLYSRNTSPIKDRLAPFFRFPHKCMYDASTVVSILHDIGLDAEPRGSFDSDIEDIEEIECQERVENAVIVEGKKR